MGLIATMTMVMVTRQDALEDGGPVHHRLRALAEGAPMGEGPADLLLHREEESRAPG